MNTLYSFEGFIYRVEIQESIAHFADENPNNRSLNGYYMEHLQIALDNIGWPVLSIKPASPARTRKGKVFLSFQWSDQESFLLMDKIQAEKACQWFEDYSMKIRG